VSRTSQVYIRWLANESREKTYLQEGGNLVNFGATRSVDRFAEALRGFGPIGILALVMILAGNLVVVPLSPSDLDVNDCSRRV
jgi:hypothetical protein